MIPHARRLALAEELLRRFASALRATQLYSSSHPLVGRNVAAFTEALRPFLDAERSISIGVVANEFVVGDMPLPRASAGLGELLRRLRQATIERITIDAEVQDAELREFVVALARAAGSDAAAALQYPHIQVGRLDVEEKLDTNLSDRATIRRLYSDAVNVAEEVWSTAQQEGVPDVKSARVMVDSLAQSVAQNRTALLALTALKNYDNYTFTHMVNVSILTMGQARALGLDGGLLREFGLAALLHDIGKVRTPPEILNKPAKLADAEFEIMKRHTVDGAQILRRTPEIPPLAPIVAFEHHLRIDGTGYPNGVQRYELNLATMLCSISDVYDAMRSQRKYQQAYPTDRILAVLQRNDGKQFDQHLVRRFVQLLGIYPAGNMVKLDTGEFAVVQRVHAPDPYRPRVRVLFDRDRMQLPRPYDVNLWAQTPDRGLPTAVVSPVDPDEFGVDPVALM